VHPGQVLLPRRKERLIAAAEHGMKNYKKQKKVRGKIISREKSKP
jgi:hypothetical protein